MTSWQNYPDAAYEWLKEQVRSGQQMSGEQLKDLAESVRPSWDKSRSFLDRMAKFAILNKDPVLAQYFLDQAFAMIALPESYSLASECYRIQYELTRNTTWLEHSMNCWQRIIKISPTHYNRAMEEIFKDASKIPTRSEHESARNQSATPASCMS